ncbi:Pentatricopeptide repeat-containing protein [Hibiscus syriacus]|uniref:Pentatricopeptide repeat-containing protein n=1 Tax=Hibiscus syriacus TaxID=106335 RepID=A0A6A3B918_HIBSY|nr:Pentatricopeptide repeat-containing protein [Hibiscus syriacus]
MLRSVELEQYLTSDEEEEKGEGYFQAIEELERMVREPSDILGDMNDRFEWLKKENKVDIETMELMVSIMCSWVKKLIEDEADVGDVVDLLVDMDCVGLKPDFSMVDKVISMYWEIEKKEEAVLFVKNGDYMDAVHLVIDLKESGLNPEIYSYLIAMTALVKELNGFAKALRKSSCRWIRLSNWAIKEGNPSLHGSVHERLLAMYICTGRGLEAERQLWEMKLAGKEASGDLYDIVLAICASQRETSSISRLLSRIEVSSCQRRRKTFSWLLRGYVKGGHIVNAAETVIKMLDLRLSPEHLDGVAVLQELRKRIQRPGNLEAYINLCKRLYDASLIGPCLLYLYIKKYKLWVVKMVLN